MASSVADMTIDFSGCSGERRASRNSRTYAGAYIAYKAMTTPMEPVNEGSFAALKAIIPEGNIMMARYPAPMSGWSGAGGKAASAGAAEAALVALLSLNQRTPATSPTNSIRCGSAR